MILLMLRRGASLNNAVLREQHNGSPEVAMHLTYYPLYILSRLLKSVRFMSSSPRSPCLAHIDDITGKAAEIDQFTWSHAKSDYFNGNDMELIKIYESTGKESIWRWAKSTVMKFVPG
jgi:hypothetical protein